MPLHPEYRTLPMVWYVPPLSPVLGLVEDGEPDPDDVFPAIDSLRIPIQYLANLLSAGDEDVVRNVLKKLAAMRGFMREKNLSGTADYSAAASVGMDPETMEDMYRLLAIAKYEDRYVIPLAHKELASGDLYAGRGTRGLDFAASGNPADTETRDEAYFSTEELQRHARALFEQGEGSCSLDFEGGPGSCASGAVSSSDLRNKDFYAIKDDLEKQAKKLGNKVAAPNVNFFKSKKDFEAFHLKPGGSGA